MNILDKIVERKKVEVADRKAQTPIRALEQTEYFARKPYSLSQALLVGVPGIIAEFKRKSPSKGVINAEADVCATTTGYVQAGAAALSVLTDTDFFQGSDENLKVARQYNECPVLRKDFTIDPYQITEAKALGADAILLIAAILSPPQVHDLAAHARSLGLEVLLEVHNEEELRRTALDAQISPHINVVGVNNRNLKNFEVSLEVSIKLAALMPQDMVKISESGISNPENIVRLMSHGFQGFLIGETFMRQPDPAGACGEFIQSLKHTLENKLF